MSITAADILFLLMVAFTAGAGLMLAVTRNVVRAGFWLFAVLFGMAGLFVFAGAEFLAMSQVILYVGGILVLLLFGIMLTQKVRDLDPRTDLYNVLPALALCVALFGGCHFLIRGYGEAQGSLPMETIEAATPDVQNTGNALVTDYLLPFEVVSVLLLAALIGAAYLSRRPSQKGGSA
jgi:NADH-quinone oxidoreductase subunit J